MLDLFDAGSLSTRCCKDTCIYRDYNAVQTQCAGCLLSIIGDAIWSSLVILSKLHEMMQRDNPRDTGIRTNP
ncbi:UNVERIFIED_CONTAM: hypothetical protein FKN15_007262 [Acipenser sinensis]